MIFAREEQRQRLKWAFESCKNGAWGSEPDGENDVVCIRAADFHGQSGRLNDGERTLRTIEPEVFDKIALRPGDLVMEKSGGGEKQLVGRTVLFSDDRPSICSNFLARCRPAKGVDSGYLNYLMLAIYVGRGTYPHIKQSTGIQNLDLSSYLDTCVNIPDFPIQQRITRFLDEKTAQIDGLIEKKRALLDRLAEKRQALITRAVIKGLNPNAPMKPSGVDWLGDIPEHWDIAELRWYLRTASGDAIRSEDIEPDRGDAGLIPVIGGNGLMGFTESEGNSHGTHLVVGRVGAHCGNVHLVVEPSWVTDNALKVYEISGFDVLYLLYALRVRDLNTLASRNAQPLMTGEIVKAQCLPMPLGPEQREIGKFISSHALHIDKQCGLVEQSVKRLLEYRAALITTAVTGQLPELNG